MFIKKSIRLKPFAPYGNVRGVYQYIKFGLSIEGSLVEGSPCLENNCRSMFRLPQYFEFGVTYYLQKNCS